MRYRAEQAAFEDHIWENPVFPVIYSYIYQPFIGLFFWEFYQSAMVTYPDFINGCYTLVGFILYELNREEIHW